MIQTMLRTSADALFCAGTMYAVCAYGTRARQASELELTICTMVFTFFMMLPMLRSKLVRRRLWVNVWMREKALLTGILQGGVIFATFTFCLTAPWATLLLAELSQITDEQAMILSLLAGLTTLLRTGLQTWFSSVFDEVPSSLFSREWSARIYLILGIFCLIPTILYQDRIDLNGRSLQDALLLSGITERGSFGIFGLIRELAALKEVSFWWLIDNIDRLLTKTNPVLIQIVRYGLGALYTLYAISIVYCFTRLVSALHELTDPIARRFFWGQKPLHDQ